MTFDEWLAYGVANGFCSDQYCSTHEPSPPEHPTETKAWDEGYDPCCHIVRLGSIDQWEYHG